VLFEGEVPAVEQHDLGILQIPAVGLGARHEEKGVILSPDDERARLMLAKVSVPGLVSGDIGLVVDEEGELGLGDARAIEQGLIERPRVGVEDGRIPRPRGVLHPGRLRAEEAPRGAERRLVLLLPQRQEEIRHRLADAFHVGIRVLDHQPAHPLGLRGGEAQPHRAAEVVQIEDIARDLELLEQTPGHLCQVIEGVRELRDRGRIRVAVADHVRGDHVEVIGQPRDEIPEHVRRGRIAVQQHDRGGMLVAGFADKDLQAVDLDGTMRDHGGNLSQGRSTRPLIDRVSPSLVQPDEATRPDLTSPTSILGAPHSRA
jgi:hypothetical protein